MMVEDGLPPSAVSGRQTIFHHHRILKGRRQERGHVCASTVSAVLCMFSVCSPWSWISDVCVDLLSANVLTFIKMKKISIIQLKPLALWRYQSAHLWIFFCNCKLKTRVWTMSKYSPHILFDKCSHFASYVPSYLSVPSQLALPLGRVTSSLWPGCLVEPFQPSGRKSWLGVIVSQVCDSSMRWHRISTFLP